MNTATTINMTFLAPIKGKKISEIDPFSASLDEDPFILVPLEIKCVGKAASLALYHKLPRSRHFVAYYEKPTGDTLTARFPLNLDDICRKAERYARLLAFRTKEYAAQEKKPYDFTVSLFLDVFPYRKKEKIRELHNQEIEYNIPADDYASILAAQRPSNPCL